MVEENEARLPEDQAEKLAEGQPAEDSSPVAEQTARLDEDEQQPEIPVSEEELLEEAAAVDANDEAMSGDQTQADQEAEVEAHLDEGELIEDVPPAKEEPVADLVPEPLEERSVVAETKRRKPRSADLEERSPRLIDEGGPDFSQVPQPDGDSDGRAWYVVHCYSGYENKVRHNLEQRIESMGMKDKIFDVVVPTEEEIEVKEGKRRTVERRVFPGYILVNMILSEESWYVVRNTPGVTSFVGQGNTPLPLRPEEVTQIVKRMEADAPRIKVTFKQGERVRIVDGPFNDFRGTVAEIDMERAKVRVMVNFFGRETPVELDFLQVEKA
jgi:transcriptional antiterminator NusG